MDIPSERGGRTEPRAKYITPAGNNYKITADDRLGEGSQKQKYKDNVAAIRLLKQIEAEGRLATPDEQKILVKYVGWGGMSGVFNAYTNREEYNGLKELLTDKEFEAARESTLNAHYTSEPVIRGMYRALERFGFDGGRVLEPSMGIGNFFGLMPHDIQVKSKMTGVELDDLTGRIAKQLYQNADIRVQGFETTKLPDNFYDVAISNVPFGNYKLHDPKYNKYNLSIHDYFS